MKIEIGQNLTLNGKTYRVTGTVKRSWMLERGGRNYKVTSAMVEKMVGVGVSNKPAKKPRKSWMEKRLERNMIWNKDAKMPVTEKELWVALSNLAGDLSPENLTCDGELNRTQINAKLRAIKGEWKELEKKLGRKVSEYEAEDYYMKEIRR